MLIRLAQKKETNLDQQLRQRFRHSQPKKPAAWKCFRKKPANRGPDLRGLAWAGSKERLS